MIRSFQNIAAGSLVLALGAGLSGCSTVYPLKSMAYRSSDPRSLAQDVTVEASSADGNALRTLAWAAYSVTFECPRECPYSIEERTRLAHEIAEMSFAAIDRELRLAFGAERR